MDLFSDNIIKRFWSNVAIGEPNACWPFQRHINRSGYGCYATSWKSNIPAHRYALIITTGIKPETKVFALHSCDNKPCCNPAHLRWGTNSENIKEAYARKAGYAERAKSHMSEVGRASKGRYKMPPSQIDYMRKLRKAGFTQEQCGEWYKVSRNTISKLEDSND